MSTEDEFSQQVRNVLNHLYDYPYLERHPLALQYWPEVRRRGPTRAQRLSRLLLESIEALYPISESSEDTSRARAYYLLVLRYVEERPVADIMHEQGYSRRQFFREQQRAIAMLSALLQEKLPRREIARPADLAEESANLLDMEAKSFLANRERIDIDNMIQGVLEVISHLAKQRGVVIEYDLDPHIPSICANRTLLRQVFFETLSVLITQGSGQRIRIQTHYRGQSIDVLVTDEVGSVYAESVNEGRRVPDLEHVRHMVEMLGGQWHRMEVSPQGCTCRFDFPTDQRKTLLVIENNESIIHAFRRYLVGYDYQVVGATTGDESLRLVQEVSPDVITLDVMMPSQDGWEIIQALKSDPSTCDIPVIVCSVLEDPELAYSLGAATYLHKPVTQNTLLSALDALLGAP